MVALLVFLGAGCDGKETPRGSLTLNAPSPTPTAVAQIQITPAEGSLPIRDENDTIALLSTAAAFIGGLAGLAAVGLVWRQLGMLREQLGQASDEQRMQYLPYIRVDIGATNAGLREPDFQPPEPVFEAETMALNLATGENPVSISAWFSNHQSHPLGHAYAVRAYFLIELQPPDQEGEAVIEGGYIESRIAYLQHNRPVRITLCHLDREQVARVSLKWLSYFDFQNRR